MKVLDHILKALREAAVFNSEVQAAPICILWPDRDRQWEAIIPLLQTHMPELIVLGDYAPEKRRGPSIWLRCVIADRVDDISLPKDRTPIIYLPGVGRQDLRAIESCQDNLKPLAELQYRGEFWSQINGKDWTIFAYLKSDQGGLGLDVAKDNDTKNAMQLALYRLLDEDVSLLRGKRLDRDFFNTLLSGGDPIRDLLQWLEQGDVFQASRGENEWKAFIEVCKSQLAFNPQNEGILAGATRLANHEGPWHAVWDRYCEAPARYPTIPSQIKKCKPPTFDLFTDESLAGGWPQWNDEQEKNLQLDLIALSNSPPHEARRKVQQLEKLHGRRRSLVWAELGQTTLACALEHLNTIAEITQTSLAAGSVDELVSGYTTNGWKADDCVLRALSQVSNSHDLDAIKTAIRSIYIPWAEESARYLQKIWDSHFSPSLTNNEKECLVFIDGLRFDCTKRLAVLLEHSGLSVIETPRWAALPSVTGTGKPAVAPLKKDPDQAAEEPQGANFEYMASYQLDKAIESNGYTILEKNILIYPSPSTTNKIWLACGDIDHKGHDSGWKLSKELDTLLIEIRDRIQALVDTGWRKINVVTDHGWLLVPGGLPKINLPSALVETKWGRCASLKPGASTKEKLYPWYWNPNQYFALADGLSCFKSGEEYAHGGLSLQECLTLELTIEPLNSASTSAPVEFSDIVWKGLRCTVAIEGSFTGLFLDIRTQAGNSSSSVVVGIKPIKENGTASVVVEDESLEGIQATIVLLDSAGSLVAQSITVIGGESL